ncbi:hypothetical protein BV20DRAFT_955919 [Pilatotrama ljubarskyi]|nr:hypothetical protein BV20DRAFT_955919 [Pilatotrama ljubarskyi]
MRTQLTAFSTNVAHHLYTMHLFTRSDLKTIFAPIMLFAWYSHRGASAASLLRAALWIYLHLLQFCVSNQVCSPEEDAANKPWRPIPAERITRFRATVVRWTLLPLCLLLSSWYCVAAPGVIFALGILLHNEMKLDSHWFSRNVLNALGYAVFDAGAMAIVHGSDNSFPASVVRAHYVSVAIVLTTIHAQDFRDEAGDRIQRRLTIPIVLPRAGRLSMLIGLPIWSLWLGAVHVQSRLLAASLLGLGVLVGVRFFCLRTAASDRTSYVLYNVWLASARLLPLDL